MGCASSKAAAGARPDPRRATTDRLQGTPMDTGSLAMPPPMAPPPRAPAGPRPGASGSPRPAAGMRFDDVFEDFALLRAFTAFVTKRLPEENITFLVDARRYRARVEDGGVTPALLRTGEFLLREYISDFAPMAVSIPAYVRREVFGLVDSYGGPLPAAFEPADREITRLLQHGFWDAFVEHLETEAAQSNGSALVPSARRSTLPSPRKRVVIIGGGFCGLFAAKALSNDPRFAVTLVDTKDYFEYTPSVLKVFLHPLVHESISIPHRSALPNARVVVGEARSLDRASVHVNLDHIPYDFAVVATGSHYPSNIKGTNITSNYRSKTMQREFEDIEAAQSVVLIGGGVVGLELACEIKATFPSKDVTIVHARRRFLSRVPRALGTDRVDVHTLVLDRLRALGIHVILRERAVGWDGTRKSVVTSTGRRLRADRVYWCGGPVPLTAVLMETFAGTLDSRGYVRVEKTFQVVGEPNLFAGGDITVFPRPPLGSGNTTPTGRTTNRSGNSDNSDLHRTAIERAEAHEDRRRPLQDAVESTDSPASQSRTDGPLRAGPSTSGLPSVDLLTSVSSSAPLQRAHDQLHAGAGGHSLADPDHTTSDLRPDRTSSPLGRDPSFSNPSAQMPAASPSPPNVSSSSSSSSTATSHAPSSGRASSPVPMTATRAHATSAVSTIASVPSSIVSTPTGSSSWATRPNSATAVSATTGSGHSIGGPTANHDVHDHHDHPSHPSTFLPGAPSHPPPSRSPSPSSGTGGVVHAPHLLHSSARTHSQREAQAGPAPGHPIHVRPQGHEHGLTVLRVSAATGGAESIASSRTGGRVTERALQSETDTLGGQTISTDVRDHEVSEFTPGSPIIACVSPAGGRSFTRAGAAAVTHTTMTTTTTTGSNSGDAASSSSSSSSPTSSSPDHRTQTETYGTMHRGSSSAEPADDAERAESGGGVGGGGGGSGGGNGLSHLSLPPSEAAHSVPWAAAPPAPGLSSTSSIASSSVGSSASVATPSAVVPHSVGAAEQGVRVVRRPTHPHGGSSSSSSGSSGSHDSPPHAPAEGWGASRFSHPVAGASSAAGTGLAASTTMRGAVGLSNITQSTSSSVLGPGGSSVASGSQQSNSSSSTRSHPHQGEGHKGGTRGPGGGTILEADDEDDSGAFSGDLTAEMEPPASFPSFPVPGFSGVLQVHRGAIFVVTNPNADEPDGDGEDGNTALDRGNGGAGAVGGAGVRGRVSGGGGGGGGGGEGGASAAPSSARGTDQSNTTTSSVLSATGFAAGADRTSYRSGDTSNLTSSSTLTSLPFADRDYSIGAVSGASSPIVVGESGPHTAVRDAIRDDGTATTGGGVGGGAAAAAGEESDASHPESSTGAFSAQFFGANVPLTRRRGRARGRVRWGVPSRVHARNRRAVEARVLGAGVVPEETEGTVTRSGRRMRGLSRADMSRTLSDAAMSDLFSLASVMDEREVSDEEAGEVVSDDEENYGIYVGPGVAIHPPARAGGPYAGGAADGPVSVFRLHPRRRNSDGAINSQGLSDVTAAADAAADADAANAGADGSKGVFLVLEGRRGGSRSAADAATRVDATSAPRGAGVFGSTGGAATASVAVPAPATVSSPTTVEVSDRLNLRGRSPPSFVPAVSNEVYRTRTGQLRVDSSIESDVDVRVVESGSSVFTGRPQGPATSLDTARSEVSSFTPSATTPSAAIAHAHRTQPTSFQSRVSLDDSEASLSGSLQRDGATDRSGGRVGEDDASSRLLAVRHGPVLALPSTPSLDVSSVDGLEHARVAISDGPAGSMALVSAEGRAGSDTRDRTESSATSRPPTHPTTSSPRRTSADSSQASLPDTRGVSTTHFGTTTTTTRATTESTGSRSSCSEPDGGRKGLDVLQAKGGSEEAGLLFAPGGSSPVSRHPLLVRGHDGAAMVGADVAIGAVVVSGEASAGAAGVTLTGAAASAVSPTGTAVHSLGDDSTRGRPNTRLPAPAGALEGFSVESPLTDGHQCASGASERKAPAVRPYDSNECITAASPAPPSESDGGGDEGVAAGSRPHGASSASTQTFSHNPSFASGMADDSLGERDGSARDGVGGERSGQDGGGGGGRGEVVVGGTMLSVASAASMVQGSLHDAGPAARVFRVGTSDQLPSRVAAVGSSDEDADDDGSGRSRRDLTRMSYTTDAPAIASSSSAPASASAASVRNSAPTSFHMSSSSSSSSSSSTSSSSSSSSAVAAAAAASSTTRPGSMMHLTPMASHLSTVDEVPTATSDSMETTSVLALSPSASSVAKHPSFGPTGLGNPAIIAVPARSHVVAPGLLDPLGPGSRGGSPLGGSAGSPGSFDTPVSESFVSAILPDVAFSTSELSSASSATQTPATTLVVGRVHRTPSGSAVHLGRGGGGEGGGRVGRDGGGREALLMSGVSGGAEDGSAVSRISSLTSEGAVSRTTSDQVGISVVRGHSGRSPTGSFDAPMDGRASPSTVEDPSVLRAVRAGLMDGSTKAEAVAVLSPSAGSPAIRVLHSSLGCSDRAASNAALVRMGAAQHEDEKLPSDQCKVVSRDDVHLARNETPFAADSSDARSNSAGADGSGRVSAMPPSPAPSADSHTSHATSVPSSGPPSPFIGASDEHTTEDALVALTGAGGDAERSGAAGGGGRGGGRGASPSRAHHTPSDGFTHPHGHRAPYRAPLQLPQNLVQPPDATLPEEFLPADDGMMHEEKMAQNAIEHGMLIAENIIALLENRPLAERSLVIGSRAITVSLGGLHALRVESGQPEIGELIHFKEDLEQSIIGHIRQGTALASALTSPWRMNGEEGSRSRSRSKEDPHRSADRRSDDHGGGSGIARGGGGSGVTGGGGGSGGSGGSGVEAGAARPRVKAPVGITERALGNA